MARRAGRLIRRTVPLQIPTNRTSSVGRMAKTPIGRKAYGMALRSLIDLVNVGETSGALL